MTRATWLWCGLPVVAVMIAAFPAAAADEKADRSDRSPNVLISLTIGKTGGSAGSVPSERVYKFIGQENSEAKMLVGWRTPIPTVSAPRESDGKSPMTSFIYQNVGVSSVMHIKMLDNGRILLEGMIEISGAREGTVTDSNGQKLPLIGTFQQSLKAIVEEGKKLRVAEGPDPEGGRLSLDLEATVLR